MLTFGTDPNNPDTDGDGTKDFYELFLGFDPLDPADVGSDADNDGLTAFQEVAVHKTDPDNKDTDGDWVSDSAEVLTYGTDPNNPDTDGDGANDFFEVFYGLNPVDPTDYDTSDNDNDGIGASHETMLYGTDPNDADTDDDLMPDGWEITFNSDPLNAADADWDSDVDGFTTYEEFRLGSEPDDLTSVPEFLEEDYEESFEDSGLPGLWYTPTANAPWEQNCSVFAADESCALSAGTGEVSTVNFMARFPAGNLTLSWAAFTVHNFTVTLDGVEIYSFAGVYNGWTPMQIPISAGVHELSFRYDAVALPYGIVAIDAVSFTADEFAVRPDNLSCIAPPAEVSGSTVDKIKPFPQIPYFTLATKMLQPPGDSSRWFVLEQGGLVKVFDVADPADVRTYLDLSGDLIAEGESGLLGFAFDPDFPSVPEVYAVYSSAAKVTTLKRFILDDTDAPVSPVEQIVLTLNQSFTGHNGGDVAFGPDGMLYLAFGEDVRQDYAQQTTNLYGSMIRIDVRGVAWPSPAYTIPIGNAFPSTNPKCGPTSTNVADCPEIFAWGFRNPWRWSFDVETGDIWLGDVGNHDKEEINIVQVGGNYGWPCFEGTDTGSCADPNVSMIAPTFEYTHADGRAVVGGTVYRGSAIPELYGHYVFNDLGGSGKPIWELLPDGNGGYVKNQIQTLYSNTTNLAAGADNELYFIVHYSPDWNPGGWVPPSIGKLVPAVNGDPEAPVSPIADDLAATGCVDPLDPTQPALGLIPYDINARFWSDNAVKSRYMALPNGTTIDINGEDDWEFPVGTVLVKNFRLHGKLIETRLLMNRLDASIGAGRWEGFSYEWDDTETSATRVIGGKNKVIGSQNWIYPSGGNCDQCHTGASGGSLGPETAQLNREYLYPTTSEYVNQLEKLDEIGMFTSPLGASPDLLPRLVDPYDDSEPLEARARSYMHTNCAQCHRPGTGNPSNMDWRYTTLLANTNACDVAPSAGDLGIGPSARLIAPADPDSSVVLSRMSRRDAAGMPPIGSDIHDVEGAALLAEWIENLESCL